jgi:hypothetical protein
MKCEWKPVEDWGKNENKNIDYGSAWSVFGLWIAGHPDRTDVYRKTVGPLKGTGHICIVLRGSFFTLYYYEIVNNLTPEQSNVFEEMRLTFDKILIANQSVIEIFKNNTNLKSKGMTGAGVFPQFFNDYDAKVIAEHSDRIDEEILEWNEKKYIYKKTNRDKELERFANSKKVWDIKDVYGELLSMLNTIKPGLPDESMNIIDTIMERCEYGYHLGYLTRLELEKMKNKKVGASKMIEKANKYRRGRESKIKQASAKAFGLTPEVKEKLRRMFIYENI